MKREEHVRIVGFQDTLSIIELIDRVSRSRGIDRSSFLRETIRLRLASLGLLSKEEEKDLGISSLEEGVS